MTDADIEPSAREPHRADPPQDDVANGFRNRTAIAGLVVAVASLVVPIVISAGIQTAQPGTGSRLPQLSLLIIVMAVVGLVLGVIGLRKARRTGRGRGVAVAAICVGVFGVLAGMGQATRLAEQNAGDEGSAAAPHVVAAMPIERR